MQIKHQQQRYYNQLKREALENNALLEIGLIVILVIAACFSGAISVMYLFNN